MVSRLRLVGIPALRPGPPWCGRTRPRALAANALEVTLRGHPGRIGLSDDPVLDLVHEVVVVADRGRALQRLPVACVWVRQEVLVRPCPERGQDARRRRRTGDGAQYLLDVHHGG